MKTRLLQWWYERSQREQVLIGVGGFLIIILLVYILVWKPLTSNITTMRQTIQDQTALLSWLDTASSKIQQYESAGYTKRQASNQPLLVLTEQTLMQNKLSQYVTNTQQKSDNEIIITLKNIPFDRAVDWLEMLWKRDNVVVSNMNANKTKTMGLVNLTVTLGKS